MCERLTMAMGQICKRLSVCAAFLLVLSLPAFAGSVYNFSSQSITGNSGSTVSGSFTFTPSGSGGTFSNLSLSFNGGVFNGINASDPSGGNAICWHGSCRFSWKEQVGKIWVWDTIVLNLKTGAYQDFGGIYSWRNQWNFDPPLPVPEGGTPLAYLMLSGLAVFAGILLSGKKRRTV